MASLELYKRPMNFLIFHIIAVFTSYNRVHPRGVISENTGKGFDAIKDMANALCVLRSPLWGFLFTWHARQLYERMIKKTKITESPF